jgi:hypothetical protein
MTDFKLLPSKNSYAFCVCMAMAGVLLATPIYAQRRGAGLPAAPVNFMDNISREGVEAHLSFLASDALRGREAGTISGAVAAEYIQSILKLAGVKPFYGQYSQPFEAFSPSREKGADFQVHPDSISRYKQLSAQRRLALQNVIGYIEGELKDEYIVVGAHYDHVGVDESLVGDKIYNGADDNASGVAALLQVAKAFAASGTRPLRSILFAFWDGEEVNYLGSEYFALNFAPCHAVRAYINLDMISCEGFVPILYPEFSIPEEITDEINATGNQFHLLYTPELTGLGEQITRGIETNQLPIEAKRHILTPGSRGSDYLPFTLRGVPILWFFTGLHPDYHTPADEVERIDLDKLTGITKATFLSLWYIANDESLK